MAFKFCPNCGTQINGANFCPNCGTKVAQSIETPAQDPIVSQPMVSMANNANNNANDILKRFGFNNPSIHNDAPPPQPKPSGQIKSEPIPQQNVQDTPASINKSESSKISNDIPSLDDSFDSTPQNPIQTTAIENENTNNIRQRESKKKIQEIRNTPDETTNSTPAIRRKRPEKKERPSRVKNHNSQFSDNGGFQDEQVQADEPYIRYVSDNIYNQADETAKDAESILALEQEEAEEETPKKISRAANTAGSSISKYSSALVSKATDIAAKKLINEDKKLDNVHKTYILEEKLLADPNDPSYDGYYENVIPIDEREKEKSNSGNNKKLNINEDTKKTLIIAGILIVGMVILIFREFM